MDSAGIGERREMSIHIDLDVPICKKKRNILSKVDKKQDIPAYLTGTVVAVGYFGRPKELASSCSEFPCVMAHIMDTNGKPSPDPIEFVIDTLSESVTLTEENFKLCKKKYLTRRTITCPNNISYEDDIYVGNILIGEHLFQIETSRDTVNSLPSKLFSIFDHVVTRGKHYWIWPSTE
jgi:hypothetical protein